MSDESRHDRPRRNATIWRWVAVVAAVGVAVIIGTFIRAAMVSWDAEKTLHASYQVVRLIERFVDEQRRWPRSWEELEQVTDPREGMFAWPQEAAEVQRRVTVDFGIDLQRLVQFDPDADPEGFTAIVPRSPYFEFRDAGRLADLLVTARRVLDDAAAE